MTAYDEEPRSYALTYQVPGRNEAEDVPRSDYEDLSEAIDPIFVDMWQRFAQSGDGAWRKAIFTLDRSGKAHIGFQYPPKA
ncbi:MAG: DUF600 family protein [Deltaproteobacteria bacterium]|nr:DUF600 family protein [Deltaproteobacteria bacterium]